MLREYVDVRSVVGDDSTDIRDLLSRNTGVLEWKILGSLTPPSQKKTENYSERSID